MIRLQELLKIAFDNPGKGFVIIFIFVLAVKTFVLQPSSETSLNDMDLDGIASSVIEPSVEIVNIEQPSR